MTPADIRSLAEAATPGPWVRGWFTAQAASKCDCEAKGRLLGTYPQRQYPGAGPFHVHEDDLIEDPHRISQAQAPFDEVAGNFDHEAGGIVGEADAAYLAALDPQTVLALLDELDALEAALADLVAFGPTEDGNPDGQMWCSNCQSSLGEPHREDCLWQQARAALAAGSGR